MNDFQFEPINCNHRYGIHICQTFDLTEPEQKGILWA